MPKGFVTLLKTALNIQGPAARILKVPVTFRARNNVKKRMLEQAPAS